MQISKFFYKTLFLALALVLFSINSWAQSSGSLPEFLSLEERDRVLKEGKEKDRTEALIKMSSGRLEVAKTNFQAENFELSRNEIKNYGNLIDYTITFINSSVKKDGDKKKLFKMLDLSLRRDLAVLETLRFELPGKYAEEANEVYERVRKARVVALGAIFGKEFFPTD
ncbi:MAG: hypothetical protein HY819_13875 [Acidobacteria bacterium]|nr:hypothetical protein [Acidobacteriota bacterium]